MRQGPSKHLTGSALDSRVAQFGMRSFVRSVQRGTFTMGAAAASGTVTITTVDTSNAVLTAMNNTPAQAANVATAATIFWRTTLTNSTTITFNSALAGDARIIYWELIEYWPGVIKSKQTGTITVSGVSSATATVTAVNESKSILFLAGNTCVYNGAAYGDPRETPGNCYLLNSTTVRVVRGSNDAAYAGTWGYQLVEFY